MVTRYGLLSRFFIPGIAYTLKNCRYGILITQLFKCHVLDMKKLHLNEEIALEPMRLAAMCLAAHFIDNSSMRIEPGLGLDIWIILFFHPYKKGGEAVRMSFQ